MRIDFEPGEAPDGYLYYVDRSIPEDRVDGTAVLMRVPVDGGPETMVLERPDAISMVNGRFGHLYITREREFDAIDRYSFSDRKVSRLGLATKVGQFRSQMTVSRETAGEAIRHIDALCPWLVGAERREIRRRAS